LGSFSSSPSAFANATQGFAPKDSSGAKGCFFAAINRVAKHFRYGLRTTGKVDLKTMGLLFGAPFGVNAPDVFFGLRVWTRTHEKTN
jgi:hypothetical protein